MKRKGWILLIIASIALCTCGRDNSNKDISLDTGTDMPVIMEYSVDMSNDKSAMLDEPEASEIVDAGSTGFQPDYSEGEQNEVSLSEQVVGQGKWIYYYTSDQIKKMNEDRNVYDVCSISDVTGISVLGDWIYYATYSEIGKIRTDGTGREVIANASISTPFLVKNNVIYYFEQYKETASSTSDSLHIYDVEAKEDIEVLPMGEYGASILGYYNNKVYLKLQDEGDGETFAGYITATDNGIEVGEFGTTDEITGAFKGGFVYGNQLIYSQSTGWNNGTTNIYIANLDNEEFEYTCQFEFMNDSSQALSGGKPFTICGACNISGEEYWVARVDFSSIYLIPVDDAKKTLPKSLMTKVIVEEDKMQVSIYDSWVVGEYVYYKGAKNGNDYLYRIKIDGTNWSELY